MNLRNTFITLGIVLAVLALGIAYAAMNSQTLNVVGNVATTTDDSNLRIYFVEDEDYPSIQPGTTADDAEISAEILDDHNAKFSVSGLNARDDCVFVDFVIACEAQEDIATKVRVNLAENNLDDWYTVMYSVDGDIECSNDGGEYIVLRNNETAFMNITIYLNKTPITDEDIEASTGEFYINLDAEPIRNDPSLWEDDIKQSGPM